MKAKKAYIYWTHPSHTYKKIPIGVRYCPHLVRTDDCAQEHWSVCFAITEENYAQEGPIELTMLIDNDATRTFFETLTTNTTFSLFEGCTEVAKGQIL